MESEIESRDPQKYPACCQVQVRFRDMDAMGHVNNAVYFTFFELGREQYFRTLVERSPDLPRQAPATEFYPFVIIEAYCRYHAPVEAGQEIRVYVRVTDIRQKSFRFEYLVLGKEDKLVATGFTTQVCFDYRQRRTMEIPPPLLRAMQDLEGLKTR